MLLKASWFEVWRCPILQCFFLQMYVSEEIFDKETEKDSLKDF